MINITGATEGDNSEIASAKNNEQVHTPSAEENMKRYALLVWRICKHRQSEAIDRNSNHR